MNEFDSETVFRRTLNRVFVLLRFPRIRAISIDDFFQQMSLNIEDFEAEWPARIWIETEYEQWAEDYIKEKAQGKKLIGLHPFALNPRSVYSEKRWLGLLDLTIERGFMPVIFGSTRQQNSEIHKRFSKQIINLVSEIPLRKKVAILKRCDFYVGLDAGVKDLAFLYAIPCIILSNASKQYARNPAGYLWAYAWAEKFVQVLNPAQGLDPEDILGELFKLEGTKGRWKKQSDSL